MMNFQEIASEWAAFHAERVDARAQANGRPSASRMAELANRPLMADASDAATVHCGSDANPATVLGQVGGFVTIQMDAWKVVKGGEHDGSAEYEYRADPNGARLHFRRNKKNRYVPVVLNDKGRWINGGYGNLSLGHRRRYYDPHF